MYFYIKDSLIGIELKLGKGLNRFYSMVAPLDYIWVFFIIINVYKNS